MNLNFLIFVIIVCITLSSGNQTVPKCKGSLLNFATGYLDQIVCDKSAIVGKPFEQILREVKGGNDQDIDTFDQFAPNLQYIVFNVIRDNLTIAENSLSLFPKLHLLAIQAENDSNIHLDIHPSAFSRTRKLTALRLGGMSLTNNTLRAIENVKDQLNDVRFEYLSPVEKIFETASKFTNLTGIRLQGMYDGRPQPDIRMEKTAASLKSILISNCNYPILKSNVLSKLTNLKSIGWIANNTTRIESGTFDNLEQLQVLGLHDNNLHELPDGLFNRNKKLLTVNLRQGGRHRLNVSPANFTHCDQMPRLLMDE